MSNQSTPPSTSESSANDANDPSLENTSVHGASGANPSSAAAKPLGSPAASGAVPQQDIAVVDGLVGQVIDGKYRVTQRLGHGGMGAVFRAEHEVMERSVALKVLHPHLAQNQELLKRFQHEARVASKLRHPNAIATYDYGMFQGSPYLVMEFVEGKTLRALIAEQGPLKVNRVAEIFRQAGSALAQAHRLGIIHRDLKPDNIMLVPQDDGTESAVVLDFGIAKVLTEQGGDRTVLTQAGTFFGTPRYASPEQAAERPPDRRSDIYALGIIMYEALSGEVPFNATSVMELLIKHLQQEPVPLRTFKPELRIPEEVDAIVMKCLKKRPEDRFQTIEELLEALAATQSGPVHTGGLSALRAESVSSVSAAAAATPVNRGPVWAVLGLFLISAGAVGWYWFGAERETAVVSAGDAVETTDSRKKLLDELVNSMGGPSGEPSVGNLPTVSDSRVDPQPNPSMVGSSASDQNKPSALQIVGGLAKLFNQGKESAETTVTNSQPENPSEAPSDAPGIVPSTEDDAQIVDASTSSSTMSEPPSSTEVALPTSTPADSLPASGTLTPESAAVETVLKIPSDPAAARREAIRRYDSGMKFYRQKRYAEAAAKFEEAVQFRSDAIGSFIALGTCYQRLNQNENAIRAFKNATRIDPAYGPARYNFAAFYAVNGQTELALAELKRAFEIDPRAKAAARREPDFASLRSNPSFQALLR